MVCTVTEFGRPRCTILCVLLTLLLARPGDCGYLIVSSPTEKKLHYTRLSSAAEAARGRTLHGHVLLEDGLKKPMGIAVDNIRKWLYIADPGASAVLAAQLFEHTFRSGLTVSEPIPVLSGVAAHWVAVDALGTLYCSDVDGSFIQSLSADALAARVAGYEGPPIKQVYAASVNDPLNKPQGLAADGFHLFWANGQPGQGTIVRGLAAPEGFGSYKGDVLQLADNVDEAFGVCLSASRVFYTSRTARLYSMRTSGGAPTLISDSLHEPRGCAFDGEGTVFVADAQVGEVYAFASGSGRIGRHRLTKALRVPGAYGVAVVTSHAAQLVHVGAMVWMAVLTVGFRVGVLS